MYTHAMGRLPIIPHINVNVIPFEELECQHNGFNCPNEEIRVFFRIMNQAKYFLNGMQKLLYVYMHESLRI